MFGRMNDGFSDATTGVAVQLGHIGLLVKPSSSLKGRVVHLRSSKYLLVDEVFLHRVYEHLPEQHDSLNDVLYQMQLG